MITLREYLGKEWKSLQHFLSIEHQQNIDDLVERLNRFRSAYGEPMIVTSGYRTAADHRRIYKAKGVEENKIPWGSKHLSGQACDFADNSQALLDFILNNKALLISCGFWVEHPAWTVTPSGSRWIHLQTVPPASGKRFFIPNNSPPVDAELFKKLGDL